MAPSLFVRNPNGHLALAAVVPCEVRHGDDPVPGDDFDAAEQIAAELALQFGVERKRAAGDMSSVIDRLETIHDGASGGGCVRILY